MGFISAHYEKLVRQCGSFFGKVKKNDFGKFGFQRTCKKYYKCIWNSAEISGLEWKWFVNCRGSPCFQWVKSKYLGNSLEGHLAKPERVQADSQMENATLGQHHKWCLDQDAIHAQWRVLFPSTNNITCTQETVVPTFEEKPAMNR